MTATRKTKRRIIHTDSTGFHSGKESSRLFNPIFLGRLFPHHLPEIMHAFRSASEHRRQLGLTRSPIGIELIGLRPRKEG